MTLSEILKGIEKNLKDGFKTFNLAVETGDGHTANKIRTILNRVSSKYPDSKWTNDLKYSSKTNIYIGVLKIGKTTLNINMEGEDEVLDFIFRESTTR